MGDFQTTLKTPKVKKFYKLTATACALYSAFDSAAIIFAAVYGFIAELGAPWFVGAGVGLLVVVVVSFVIDYGLKQGLQTWFARLYATEAATYRRLVLSWSGLFIVLQLSVTIGLTMYGRTFITQAVVRPAQAVPVDNSAADAHAAQAATIAAQVVQLDKEQSAALAAVNAANPALLALNSDWSRAAIGKKRKAVADKFAAQRTALRASALQSATAATAAREAAQQQAAYLFQQDANRAERAAAALDGVQMWMAIGSSLLLVLALFLAALEDLFQRGKVDGKDGKVYKGAPVKFATSGAQASGPQNVTAQHATATAPSAQQSATGVAKNATAPPRMVPREIAPETLGLIDVRVSGIDGNKIVWNKPSRDGLGFTLGGEIEIASAKSQLRTYRSELEKINNGQPSARNAQTVLDNVERLSALLKAVGK